jgi:histidyl-tRNA synthetase
MKFQAIKGVRDILPPDSAAWNRVEQTAREVFESYGFGEIRLPIFEQTELFARSIGVETDVVSKEMYTWEDRPQKGFDEGGGVGYGTYGMAFADGSGFGDGRGGQLMTLRPEATASVCRAYIEHGMHTRPGNVKLYYIGPMFRRERPQKGRYRQFYQIGAEVLSPPIADAQKEIAVTATIDAEVIEMLMHFFGKVGLGERPKSEVGSRTSDVGGQTSDLVPQTSGVTLYINSIGCKECRPAYVEKLRAALTERINDLKADSQRRVETNPLRVLDSKLPEEQAVIETLPRITDYLCEPCKTHYAELKKQLQMRNMKYEENWRLVRGLDYYMRTTFEITAPGLGSQNAVCGGGRYDGLVELLGGPPTKGIGFAIGTDRLMLSLAETRVESPESREKSAAGVGASAAADAPHVFIAWMGAASQPAAIKAARTLRDAGLRVEMPAEEMKFRKSLDLANRLGAHYALIIGEDEVKSGEYTLKRLSDGVQTKLFAETLVETIKASPKEP